MLTMYGVDMVFKKLHVGVASFHKETLDEIRNCLDQIYNAECKRMRHSLSHINASSHSLFIAFLQHTQFPQVKRKSKLEEAFMWQ